MTTAAKYLVIHQGLHSTCSYLFRSDGRLAARGEMEQSSHTPAPGWQEQSPVAIWARTHKSIRIVREEGAVRPGEIAAIGLIVQPGIAAWSRANDRPLYPALVGVDLRNATWLLQHVEAVRNAATRDDLMLGSMDAWLSWNLTGILAATLDNAARLGLLDATGQTWDADRLAELGLEPGALPTLTPALDRQAWGCTCSEGPLGAVAPLQAVLSETPGKPIWETILTCRTALTALSS